MSSEKIIEKGFVLKETRESKGISLESVHQETKIPLDALKAIEEGYSIRTLSSFYLNGFTKMYAQYLGVDTTKILKEEKKEKVPEFAAPKPKEKPLGRSGTDVFLEKMDEIFTERRKHQFGKALFAILVIFILLKVSGFVRHKSSKDSSKENSAKKTAVISPTEKKEAPRVKQPSPKEVAPKLNPVSPSAQPVATASQPSQGQTAGKKIMLSVRAKQYGWLQVKTDGNVVFQSVLKKGMTETWAADKEIELSGRNISELEFELNGKVIGSLGREGRDAKRVIFTKQGLSVKK